MERMKKKVWRRRMAAWLIVSLCAGLCPAPAAATAAEPETVAQEETKDIEQSPEEVETEEDTAWEDEEVVVEVDENGKDEWGNTYKIEKVAANKYEMTLAGAGNKLPQNKNGEFMFRVADKVIMDEKEYEVTAVIFSMRRQENIQMYIGKNVKDIRCFLTQAYGFIVHSENPVYASEDGCLYSKDKKKLYYFGDQNYGKEEIYQLPENVEALGNECFCDARVKEVILNEKIQTLPIGAFRGATIQKIDLRNVTTIGNNCFNRCKYLEEIKMDKEGITIGQNAFDGLSSLKNLFFPPHTKLKYEVINNMHDETLETMVFGGEAEFEDSEYFANQNKIGLKTLILPNNLKQIGSGIAAVGVLKLRKLYIPDTVEKIGNGALNSKGNLALYGKSNSVAVQYDDDNVSFHSLEGHEHKLEDVTFFSYDTWGVKGKYCKECAYAQDIKKVDYMTEEARDSMPELLVQPKEQCPECLELDEKNTDNQGVIYKLDDVTNTALVKKTDDRLPFLKEIFLIPENVEKDGKRYEVKVLLSGSLSNAEIVVLPDTITDIESGSFSYGISQVELGENVENIQNGVFLSSNITVSIRGNNKYYKIVDDVLFDAEMKKLLCYMRNNTRTEYTVPASVRFIGTRAFDQNQCLEKIYIPNEKNVLIDEWAFETINGEVIDLQQTSENAMDEDGYAWNGEDKVSELDDEYMDDEGFYYKLNGAKLTASVYQIDMSKFNSHAKEIDMRIPDKVRHKDREYKVTEIKITLKENRDMHYIDRKNYRNQMVNLYIGKYVTWIAMGSGVYKLELKITSYVHVLNKSFVSDKGSLFDKNKEILYRFCDCEYKGKDYVLPHSVRRIEDYAFYQADIESITFNHWITAVTDSAFKCSNVKKVDLGHVKKIGKEAFAYCYYLNEVIFHEEGITIEAIAFYMTKNLKKMYIPENSSIGFFAFGYSGIQTLIMGENATLAAEGAFSNCYDLQVINLQEGMEELENSTFEQCFDLQKLYIPKTLQFIEKYCLYYTSLKLYCWNPIEVELLSDDRVDCTVVLLEDHVHSFKEVTFMAFDTWMVTGKYCEECGAVEEIRKEETDADTVLARELVGEKKKCASVCEIDQYNKDEEGNEYELNSDAMTAALLHAKETKARLVYIPEKVRKNGKVYTVDTIASRAVSSLRKVVFPDTIKKLEKESIRYTEVIYLGAGVEEIDENAFTDGRIMDIRISEDNPYFLCEEDALMDQDKTILYVHSSYGPAEYNLPASVKKIVNNAFSGYMIHQINVPDIKKIEVPENWGGRDAYINNMAASESDNEEIPSPAPMASPSVAPTVEPTSTPVILPTPKPSATPTASPSTAPTVSPSVVPTTEPTSTPVILPTPKPTVTPTASPSTAPTVSPSVVPTTEPTSTPVISPTRQPSASPTVIPTTSPSVAPTPTATPTLTPTSSPTASPIRQPSASPSVLPTLFPVISPEPVTLPTLVPDSTATSNPSQPAQIPENISDTTKNEKPDLTIHGFRLTSRGKGVSITWNRCPNAEFYQIYRAEKNGKYQLVQVLTSIKTSYVDKNAKPAKRYFYKIRAVGNENGVLQEGAEKRLSITLSGLEKPVIKVKKGKTDLVRYISVILKKYGGTHAQVYMSLNGKKYTKLKMTSGKIAKFRGTFRFQCELRRKVLWLKVRTYKRNKKGRTYSGFSKAAKIRV